MAEDLGAVPIWVFNNGSLHTLSLLENYIFNFQTVTVILPYLLCLYLSAGISHQDEVDTSNILPFIQVSPCLIHLILQVYILYSNKLV